MRKSLKRLSSRRQTRKDEEAKKKNQSSLTLHSFEPNEAAWVSDPAVDHDWLPCTVLVQSGIFATIKLDKKRNVEQVDLRARGLWPANKTVEADMTSLHHINEPGILYNLEQRSYEDEPYTFMGNVLVAVNPLKRIPDPPGALGTRKATRSPHPFAIAEFAFQQMSFAADQRKRQMADDDAIVNQSVVTSGESGAGKTESSKMVLRHLVKRTLNTQEKTSMSEIDRRLLESNPITEAFGNASTLRNGNSSRFGKFMKLHFEQLDSPRGEPARWHIGAASVQTYLLERSRVTMHEEGERNYHCFYLLLSGMDGATLASLGLDRAAKFGFRYLSAVTASGVNPASYKKELHKADDKRFGELTDALDALGFDDAEREAIWRTLAGVLHLGNVAFEDHEEEEGDVANVVAAGGNYDPLSSAAEMLGVDAEALERLLIERMLSTRDGTIVVHRNANAASFARDAVAKGIYSVLFDHIVTKINEALDETSGGVDPEELPFIGVLDIFGFESFKRNGFEQLLINFTNESLQSTFNKKVFEAELQLYEREGLVLDHTMSMPPGNEAAMELLAGKRLHPGTDDYSRENKNSILMDLDDQGRGIDPSDSMLLKTYNKKFSSHPNYNKPRIHPKYAHEKFRIVHYAGAVVYTVENFIVKNNDALPNEANDLFAGSTSSILAPEFAARAAEAAHAGHGRRAVRSIVRGFRTQIMDLADTLDKTACSFIRCVKPNSEMKRGKSRTWFDRAYVGHQLKHLSIPQTAVVLRSGLPTRLAYSALVESYMSVLPSDATQRFLKSKGQIDGKKFVMALFWAFEINPATFKLGHTKVFFKAGEISSLDKVLQEAALWTSSNDPAVMDKKAAVVKRFRLYYTRLTFRRAAVRYIATQYFLRRYLDRKAASIVLQCAYRSSVAREALRRLRRTKEEAEEEERRQREEEERLAREEEERRKREEELAAREAEEAAKLQAQLERHKTLVAEQEAEREAEAKRREEEGLDDDDDDDGDGPRGPMALGSMRSLAGVSRHGSVTSSKRVVAPTRVYTQRFSANDSDDEDDPDDDHDDDDSHMLAEEEDHFDPENETEEERISRVAREIYEDAQKATAREVERLERNGETVDEVRRAAIQEDFEREYREQASKYEARRQRNERLKEESSKWLTSMGDSVGSSLQAITHGVHTAVSSGVHALVHHGPKILPADTRKAVEESPTYKDMRRRATEYHENLTKMNEHRTQAAEEELNHKVERLGRGGADQPAALRRQATTTGAVVHVNESEIASPMASVTVHVEQLKKLVTAGVITPEQLSNMMKDMSSALDRPDTRQSDVTEYEDESLDDEDEGDDLEGRPGKEDWISQPLSYRQGSFFLRMGDKVNTEFSDTELDSSVFIVQCAWQDEKDRRIYGRWNVQVREKDLQKLAAALEKKKSKVLKLGKKDPMPEFPLGVVKPVKSKRRSHRFFRSHTKRPSTPAQPQMSQQEINKVAAVDDWLEEIIDHAYHVPLKRKASHPIFAIDEFDDCFEVKANVEYIINPDE
ncbi:Myosin-13 [Hondaea fermentalgiana]|uniref:Myosin-13 n=1 Tax=Hondaea fermentalgiana TaxID=2315210 RepID=A0A2R5G2J4_9STRA|nr:Myosin-13 [Hondaea fermentalgiana]|eukprot:GBG23948.1 Myosin-13 [Hondaea fermentalgiana]